MSRAHQHYLPIGATTALLFSLAKYYANEAVELFSPREVSLWAVIVYFILTLCLSAAFSLFTLFPWAKAVERQEQRQCVMKIFPLMFLPFLGISVWIWISLEFTSLLLYVLPFLLATTFGLYWSVLLLERFLIYGFTRITQKTSA
jgi:hypothetical protein